MRISYKVAGNYLIESASLPFVQGRIYLITGVETPSFALLGGLIAKLFPVTEELEWPQLQALLQPYSGTLEIEEGELPTTTAYVGADPDRHILFSKVWEEVLAQTNDSKSPESSLQKFGLDESFLDRQISSLSGGEKMKVALSIAFSQLTSCYILHGVVPWLDKKGRNSLRDTLIKVRAKGGTVILLEQEIHPLLNHVDEIFLFDGKSVSKVNGPAQFSNPENGRSLRRPRLDLSTCHEKAREHNTILSFNDVFLPQHPFSETTCKNALLENVRLSLQEHRSYFLIGENGSGKSTLAQLALRVIEPTSGEIWFDNKPITHYQRKQLVDGICYVAQFPEQQITLSNYGQYRRRAERTHNDISLQLMHKYLSLSDNFPVSQLSFLQMKLLCLTSFVTNQTRLVILDEPTWGLDGNGQDIMIEILNEIAKQLCFSLLIISHDLTLMHSLFASVLWLDHGNIRVYDQVSHFLADRIAVSHFDVPPSLLIG